MGTTSRQRRGRAEAVGISEKETSMPEMWNERFSREHLMRRVGGLQQVAGVRLMSFEDGIERGGRVLEFRTGSGFEFDVLVDRAFDIGRCEISGQALGWHSGVGFSGPW